MGTSISMVVPTFNEADRIEDHLRYHQDQFDLDELIVVDGGSQDATVSRARSIRGCVHVLEVDQPSRGGQFRHGVEQAGGDWILMLHADTRLPREFQNEDLTSSGARWGWFDCRLDAPGLPYMILSRAISLRSALFSTPTGDQAIWCHRDLLNEVGGVPDVPIMEDVVMVKRLREQSPGHRIRKPVVTSARKWKEEGVVTVILSMWWFRLAHVLGAPPGWIYRRYYGTAPETRAQ